MSAVNVVAGVQAGSFGVLGFLFLLSGDWRLGLAQFAYLFTTILLFTK